MTKKTESNIIKCQVCGDPFVRTTQGQQKCCCKECSKENRIQKTKDRRETHKNEAKVYNHEYHRTHKFRSKSKKTKSEVKPQEIEKILFISHLNEKLNYAHVNFTTYAELQKADTIAKYGRVVV